VCEQLDQGCYLGAVISGPLYDNKMTLTHKFQQSWIKHQATGLKFLVLTTMSDSNQMLQLSLRHMCTSAITEYEGQENELLRSGAEN